MVDYNATQLWSFSRATMTPDPHPAAQRFAVVLAGDNTVPQVVATPASGTPISPSDAVQLDVTDETGLRRVIIMVQISNERYVVHDGDVFCGFFSNLSSRVAIPGGWRYSIKRSGGWSSSPAFYVSAVDQGGNEAL